MQTTDKKDLPLRARYYQSLMDIETRAFLRYVATKEATTGYTERLESRVRGLKVTPREQLYYQNWIDFRDEAREEGREEGSYETRLDTARRMLDDGLSKELAAKYTGLPIDEIQQLAQTAAQ